MQSNQPQLQQQPAPARLSPAEEQLAQAIAGIARRTGRPIAARRTPSRQ